MREGVGPVAGEGGRTGKAQKALYILFSAFFSDVCTLFLPPFRLF